MELTAAEAWSRILERARAQLPEQIYRSWLEQTEPVALSQDQLAIATHNEFAVSWIEKQYGNLLTQAAERLFGRPFTIAVHHQPLEEGGVGTARRPAVRISSPPAPAAGAQPAAAAPRPAPLTTPSIIFWLIQYMPLASGWAMPRTMTRS